MKKRLFTLLLASTTMFSSSIMATELWTEPTYTEKWTESEIIFDVPPIVENGRTLVPLRKIFEVLGAHVDWNNASQQITAVKGSTTIILKIGSNIAYVNNRAVTLDTKPKIINGRTLVPIRFVSESLGSKVEYDSATTKITIDNMYSFHINKPNATNPNNVSNNSYVGKWNIWVPGSFTGPNDYGSHGYVGGAAGGYIDIKSDGTFV